MQAGRHNVSWYRQRRTRPCKKRKDGAPTVSKRETGSKPGPPAPGLPDANKPDIRRGWGRTRTLIEFPKWGWAGGPGFDLAGATTTVGAPSLRLLQGRVPGCRGKCLTPL